MCGANGCWGFAVVLCGAACEQILRAADVKTELHSNGTGIEGEWDVVMKRCVPAMGAARVYTTIKVSTRMDRDQSQEEKVQRVLHKLED